MNLLDIFIVFMGFIGIHVQLFLMERHLARFVEILEEKRQ